MATSNVYKKSIFKIIKDVFFNSDKVSKLTPSLDEKFNSTQSNIVTSEITVNNIYIGFLIEVNQLKMLKIIPRNNLQLIDTAESSPYFVENKKTVTISEPINSISFRQGNANIIACLFCNKIIKVYNVIDERTDPSLNFQPLKLNLLDSIDSLTNIKLFRWSPINDDLRMLITYGPTHSDLCYWILVTNVKCCLNLAAQVIDIAWENLINVALEDSIAVSTNDKKIKIFSASMKELTFNFEFEEEHNQKIIFLNEKQDLKMILTCGKKTQIKNIPSLFNRPFLYKVHVLDFVVSFYTNYIIFR